MKQKLSTLVIIMAILTIMTAPVYATTDDWSFTMDNRYVNGKDNGVIHSLDAGDLSVDGEVWNYDADPNPLGPYTIHVNVYRDKFGPDDNVGEFTIPPLEYRIGASEDFSEDLGNVDSGDYYLEFFKANSDGWHVKGEGTIETN